MVEVFVSTFIVSTCSVYGNGGVKEVVMNWQQRGALQEWAHLERSQKPPQRHAPTIVRDSPTHRGREGIEYDLCYMHT